MSVVANTVSKVANAVAVPKVVFVVPYRNRPQHKFFFSNYLTSILKGSDIELSYEIYFSHQCDARSFNRGATKNIGFLAVKQKYPNDIFLDYENVIDEKNDEKIKNMCNQNSDDIVRYNLEKPLDKSGIRSFEYQIAPVYKTRWTSIVGYSILILLVMIVVTEIIRRIFYYIIFGKLFPQKK